MLYQIGLLTLDTDPMQPDRVRRQARADFAAKPVIGALQPREAQGPGEDRITLSGELLPLRLGGLTELALAHEMMAAQRALPVMRGDGHALGYRVIEAVEEDHDVLTRHGPGARIAWRIELVRVPAPAAAEAASLIAATLGLFDLLR